MSIVLKSPREIAKMHAAGRIVKSVLDRVEAACAPGVSTGELNAIAARELSAAGARSAFLGYAPGGLPPFPAVLCTSVNNVVIHGIPSNKHVLKEGDILGVDFACFLDGHCADSARTIEIGRVSAQAHALVETTRECLERAIVECVPGKRLGDIGAAVQELAEARGYGVVRDFTGHGIGTAMHEAPDVTNYGKPGTGMSLRAGLVIAIEPMIAIGSAQVKVLKDGWTVTTADGGLAAHVEHTVAITEEGPIVLTR